MIWASTREGQITYAGPEWTVFTGQSSSAALNSGWLDMLHKDDREKTSTFFSKACATASAFTITYRLYHKSGTYISVVAGAMPSISPVDQTFIGFLGTVNEVGDNEGHYKNVFGKAVILPSGTSTRPSQSIDQIADYLLLARTTAQQAGEVRLLASIDFAITEVMRRLGYSIDKVQ